MAFINEWDETTPANTESVNAGASRMRALKVSMRERLAIDHNFKADETDDSDIGKHSQVELIEKAEDLDAPTAGTVLYDKSGNVYMRKKTGNPIQLVDETAQTIAGVKTFSSIPVLPNSDPETDNQAARKKYVDDRKYIEINEQTDSYTLVLTDAGKIVDMNKSTANTLTVPANESVAFPTGTVVFIRQKGAGKTTIAPDEDVTINNQYGLVLTAQHAGASLLKVDTNTWVAFGSLEEAI